METIKMWSKLLVCCNLRNIFRDWMLNLLLKYFYHTQHYTLIMFIKSDKMRFSWTWFTFFWLKEIIHVHSGWLKIEIIQLMFSGVVWVLTLNNNAIRKCSGDEIFICKHRHGGLFSLNRINFLPSSCVFSCVCAFIYLCIIIVNFLNQT